MDVYGNMGLKPTYVKKAYEIAYDELKQYGLQEDVTLFYNDYNEYDVADEIVELINYINEGEEAKICGGIGMQSHITVNYPSLEKYGTAVDKFLATGLQVQVLPALRCGDFMIPYHGENLRHVFCLAVDWMIRKLHFIHLLMRRPNRL